MKLTTKEREGVRKSESKELRREGHIPAVIYGAGGEAKNIAVDRREFEAHMRQIEEGGLATTKFSLQGGVKGDAIVKDIQYHPTTYQILHLDFLALKKDVRVNVNVPIQYTGIVDCAGIKLGGFLRKVIRSLRVNCLPADIPTHLELDVRELAVKQTKRLRDIVLPKGVVAKGKMDEVAVVIAKR